MLKGIVNGSSAELLVSHGQVRLQLRSVLIENCYSAVFSVPSDFILGSNCVPSRRAAASNKTTTRPEINF